MPQAEATFNAKPLGRVGDWWADLTGASAETVGGEAPSAASAPPETQATEPIFNGAKSERSIAETDPRHPPATTGPAAGVSHPQFSGQNQIGGSEGAILTGGALAGALDMAARSFRVFPLAPGSKSPLPGFKWKAEATTDAATIRRWATDHPGCNFGVRGGQGLIVLDPDGQAGRAALAELEAAQGNLPDTLTVRTPGGGLHLYLAGPDVSNSAGALPSGIDVRGAGGYVVAPGSYFADLDGTKGYTGFYRVERDAPVAEAPQWLHGLLKGAPQPRTVDQGAISTDDPADVQRAIRLLQAADPAIEGQGGDQQTYEVACEMRDLGLSEAMACDLMAEHWNPRCVPPWEDDALALKVANAFAYAQNPPGVRSAAAAAEAFASAVPLDQPANNRNPFPLVRVSEMKSRPPAFLIRPLIERGAFACLFGDPEAGKSFNALHMACCVATGTPFFGRQVTQGPVVYLAGEGQSGIKRRVDAWSAEVGVSLSDAPLFFALLPARLLDQTQAQQVAAAVDAVAAQAGTPALIVIDTVARNFGPGDENATRDMGSFVAAVDALKGRYPDCTALLTHHTGHASKTRARGSIVLLAALDVEYRVEKDEAGTISLTNTKMKDAPRPAPMHFVLKPVSLGVDADGSEFGSAVLVEAGAPAPQTHRPPKHAEALLDAFEHVPADKHQMLAGEAAIPETYAREIFDDRVRPLFKSGGHRKAWSDALKFVQMTGQLRLAEGAPHCWILNRYPGQWTEDEGEE